ncbi:MAG: mannitol dehydrogenase family protein [Methylobacterium sp.]|nr:mannitol dehydrogenase family protein [Methylobacterium sp.]MCA3603646.1 mannitol dehydrogenase family protein [Methylobacterium sp.]MCA3614470.1 mannitol dehydrogenase family protein [Methylobacterium sp.]
MERLSPATLAKLVPSVARPAGARPAGPRIVHLGLGAFARAHLAVYTQEANAKAGTAWQIVGVSLQRPDMREALKPQAGLYTLVTRAPEGPIFEILDVVTDVLVAPENPAAVVDILADAATRIVTLTVTEKGYCHLPSTGRLNLEHPDIGHDLAHPDAPRSAPGFLVAGLAKRRALGLPPFTLLSCDNLPSNGRVLRGLVLEFAAKVDPALGAWIESEAAFPCCMVDRIVPATTPADIAETAAAIGLQDASPVIGEPFRQWAIEDHFVSGRPAWEMAGAEMVTEVAPYEFMKLRMLNGAHSSLAYLGYLAGHETVAEATADPLIAAFLERLWAEIIPTVPAPPGVDLAIYARRLLERFRNPAIRHRTWQIAMDGSQKLPQRLLGTLRWRLERGLPSPALTLGIAGWMRYASGQDERGRPIDIRDPLAARFAEISSAAKGDAAALARGFLGLEAVFGTDLSARDDLHSAFAGELHALLSRGARQTLAHFPNRPPNAGAGIQRSDA